MNPPLLFVVLLLLMTPLGCGRKDVNRRGEIKLRGEKPVSLSGKKSGDLLQRGIASWYGHPFHGRQTANGETYDMWTMTAAHKTLPFNTLVRVVNRDSGKEAVVRINDRGPFVRGRVIDLSREAARRLGVEGPGTAQVALYLADGQKESRRSRARSRPVVQERGADLPKGHWTIQVGSFSERQRAKRYAEEMRTFHQDVRVERAGKMFRVRLGRFLLKSEATKLATYLYEEQIDSWVVFAQE